MEKPTIAILGVKYYPSRGGVSRVVEDIMVQLKDQFQFVIYCYEHSEAENNISGVEVIQYPKFPFGGLGVFLYYFKCALNIKKRRDIDLVHIHKTDAAFVIPMISSQHVCIATSHEAPYKRDKWSALGKWFFKRMEAIFMNSNSILTSISKPLSDYYLERYGREVLFIPNGVDISIEPDTDGALEVLAKNNIEGDYIFFAARRIMGTKGCHTMLEGLKKINYQGNVVIAGDNTQLPSYTRQIEKLAQGLNVHFIGYVEGKSILLGLVKKAKMFIFPSETEGMSIMLLEVASMGTPIIASDIPENTAVFTDHEMLYFKNKDANDLARKFEWAMTNESEMQQRANTAKEKIYTSYTKEVIAKEYADLYLNSLSQKEHVNLP